MCLQFLKSDSRSECGFHWAKCRSFRLVRGEGIATQPGIDDLSVQGAPTTYNKDFQEAWQLMFDSVDTVNDCIRIATGVLSTIRINPSRMKSGLSADMLATDLAEYLVRKGDSLQKLLCDSYLALPAAAVSTLTNICLFSVLHDRTFLEEGSRRDSAKSLLACMRLKPKCYWGMQC